jgi:radical SAM protein with 4Fe4S-binding SPASM domain
VDILEVFPTCLFTDSPKEIQEIFSKRMCTAGNTTLTIGSEGNIRVCSYDQESYGNILEEDFKTIWKKMEKWRDNSLLPQECKDCIIVDSCGGGCKVSNNVKKGNYCELSDFYKGAIKDRQRTFFQELTSDFDLSQKYRLVNKITLREEQKNIFTLAVNPMYFIIVNETGLDIIKHLQKSGSFVPSEIIKELNIEKEKAKSFFSELYNKGFIN